MLKSLRLQGGFLSPIPRTHFQVSGIDRVRYLNSQVSNDLRKVQPGEALPCCFLTVKGKMCALAWVFEEGDVWIIDADFKVRTSLQNRLERYIVADDVQVEDLSDEGTLFHIFGKAVASQPAGIHVSRLGCPGIDVWVPKEQTNAYQQKLIQDSMLEATPEFSEPLRIEQGIPAWEQDISEATFPAEALLDHFAVDFAKGCYVGQEIVSRIRSVGRVNRRLVGLVAENPDSILVSNAKILDPLSRTSVGTLTSVAFHFELCRTVALGYLKTGFVAPTGTLLLAVHPENREEVPCRIHEFPLTPAIVKK